MADSFSANPFAALNKKQFPEKKNQTIVKNSAQKKKKHTVANEDIDFGAAVGAQPCPPEDSQLFYAAMRNVNPATSGKAGAKTQKGFALHEQQGFAPLAQTERAQPEKKAEPKPAPCAPSASETALFAHAVAQEEQHGELSAFATAMRQVTPLAGKGREVAQIPSASLAESPSLQDIVDSKIEFVLCSTGEHIEGHVLGLDEITINSLRAGACSPEAHLDLHGLTAIQAFQALLGFMRGSWFKGLRTVLLVPGRGLNSPNGYGVLRDKIQHWLTQEPFKRVVLAFCTAVPADGGAGSVYVLLRKYKKKGHVYWERLPSDPDLS